MFLIWSRHFCLIKFLCSLRKDYNDPNEFPMSVLNSLFCILWNWDIATHPQHKRCHELTIMEEKNFLNWFNGVSTRDSVTEMMASLKFVYSSCHIHTELQSHRSLTSQNKEHTHTSKNSIESIATEKKQPWIDLFSNCNIIQNCIVFYRYAPLKCCRTNKTNSERKKILVAWNSFY